MEQTKTPLPPLVSEPSLSKHELQLYGFSQQPVLGNEAIRELAKKYTEHDHETLMPHRSQSFKAGAWQARSIYEAYLAKTREVVQALCDDMRRLRIEYVNRTGCTTQIGITSLALAKSTLNIEPSKP